MRYPRSPAPRNRRPQRATVRPSWVAAAMGEDGPVRAPQAFDRPDGLGRGPSARECDQRLRRRRMDRPKPTMKTAAGRTLHLHAGRNDPFVRTRSSCLGGANATYAVAVNVELRYRSRRHSFSSRIELRISSLQSEIRRPPHPVGSVPAHRRSTLRTQRQRDGEKNSHNSHADRGVTSAVCRLVESS